MQFLLDLCQKIRRDWSWRYWLSFPFYPITLIINFWEDQHLIYHKIELLASAASHPSKTKNFSFYIRFLLFSNENYARNSNTLNYNWQLCWFDVLILKLALRLCRSDQSCGWLQTESLGAETEPEPQRTERTIRFAHQSVLGSVVTFTNLKKENIMTFREWLLWEL